MAGSVFRILLNLREISRCFRMFRLLFCEKSGEGDNVCVNGLVLSFYSVGRHVDMCEICVVRVSFVGGEERV